MDVATEVKQVFWTIHLLTLWMKPSLGCVIHSGMHLESAHFGIFLRYLVFIGTRNLIWETNYIVKPTQWLLLKPQANNPPIFGMWCDATPAFTNLTYCYGTVVNIMEDRS